MMKKTHVLITILCASLLTGCASVLKTTGMDRELFCIKVSGANCQKEKNLIYIGAKTDVELIADGKGLFVLLPLIDLPLSAACDTLFLPYTVPYTLSKDN